MDPVEKTEKVSEPVTTLGDLVNFYYEKFSKVYDSPDLRNLAVTTVIDDLLSRKRKV